MMKTAILTIGKMENHYIREFVEHYKKMGFTNIILFDNNDPDGERFEDVIGDYIESGYVIIRDYRGKYPGCAQPYAYEEGYNEFKNDFDWFAVFDIDEFLMLNERFSSIDDYLNMGCFSDADCIRVSWREMSDSGHVMVENGDYSLVKRFTVPRQTQYLWTKAIVRGGINNFVMPKDGDGQSHLVGMDCIKHAVNANGVPVSNSSIRGGADFSNAALNHYSMKTIEEFVLNKMAKGYGVRGLKVENVLSKEYFFSGNERTEEKEKLYDELMPKIRMKILLCGIGRLCNQYIREWVEYYKNLGFTNILLYDNNYDGEEDFHDAIGDYIDDGFVILEDFRNRMKPQFDAYKDCWKRYRKDYDWIAFFDVDEFLTLVKCANIEEFLSDEKFKSKNAVVINWMCYGDNDIVYNDGTGVLDRFKTPLPYGTLHDNDRPVNDHVKTIARCIDFDGINFRTPHDVNLPNQCTANGVPHPLNSCFHDCDFSVAYLRHYSTKTIDEYCTKMTIGVPDRYWDKNDAEHFLRKYFFRYNEPTKEKINVVKKRLGIDLSDLLDRQPSKMKKKLLFYLWVSPDFETNIAVKVHEMCLKRYLNVFDELSFVVAVDDYPKIGGDSLRAIKWINEICGERKYDIRIVNNSEERESRVFNETIIPVILKKEDSAYFFAHTKGITDTNMGFRNKYSVLRWIISMYYYNLEHIDDVEEKLSGGHAMYGSLLTHFTEVPNADPFYQRLHNMIYIGTFWWINPKNASNGLIFGEEIPSQFRSRWLAESVPVLFDLGSLSCFNMVFTECEVADLYHLKKELWPRYLSYYGDSDILFEMQNDIIKEICLEEGY